MLFCPNQSKTSVVSVPPTTFPADTEATAEEYFTFEKNLCKSAYNNCRDIAISMCVCDLCRY